MKYPVELEVAIGIFGAIEVDATSVPLENAGIAVKRKVLDWLVPFFSFEDTTFAVGAALGVQDVLVVGAARSGNSTKLLEQLVGMMKRFQGKVGCGFQVRKAQNKFRR